MGRRKNIGVYRVIADFLVNNYSDLLRAYTKLTGDETTLTEFLETENLNKENYFSILDKILRRVRNRIDIREIEKYMQAYIKDYFGFVSSSRVPYKYKKTTIRHDYNSTLIEVLSEIIGTKTMSELASTYEQISTKIGAYTFAIYVLVKYILHTADMASVPTVSTDIDVEKEDLYWELMEDKPYDIVEDDHVSVFVTNFEPRKDEDLFERVSDREGLIYDIIFASALLSAYQTGLFSDEVISELENRITINHTWIRQYMSSEPESFSSAFRFWQKLFVEMLRMCVESDSPTVCLRTLSSKLRSFVSEFEHLLTIEFVLDLDISRAREGATRDPRNVSPHTRLWVRPGTYWIFGSFLGYTPSGTKTVSVGALKFNDTVLFNPVFISGETNSNVHIAAIRVSKQGLYKMFVGEGRKAPHSGDIFLLLVRVNEFHKVPKKKSKNEDEEQAEYEIVVWPELLSAVPTNPMVIINRGGTSTYTRIERIREIFGFDTEPSSSKEVLESIYLLARAFAPEYAVFDVENKMLFGWDQYLALTLSALTFLSPTRTMANLKEIYGPRIHTLLYGFKGTAKTMLIDYYTQYIAPHITVKVEPSQESTTAGLVGGIETRKDARGRDIVVYNMGSLVRADGGMIGVDEVDKLQKNAVLIISSIMSSGRLPERHVRYKLGTGPVRVFASVLAAANPSAKNEITLRLVYMLHPELYDSYKRMFPSSVAILLEKAMGHSEGAESIEMKMYSDMQEYIRHLSDNLSSEYKHLVSISAYDMLQQEFYGNQTLSKFIDRITFAIPMYTMSTNLEDERFVKSYTEGNKIHLYDPLLGGKEVIDRHDLVEFSNYIQTFSPALEQGTGNLKDFLMKSRRISSEAYSIIDSFLEKAIKHSPALEDSALMLSKQMGARATSATYKLAHTITKLYDMETANRHIWDAVKEIVVRYTNILYINPLGVSLGIVDATRFIRTIFRTVLMHTRRVGGKDVRAFTLNELLEATNDFLANTQVILGNKGIRLNLGDATQLVIRVFEVLAGLTPSPVVYHKYFTEHVDSKGETVYVFEGESIGKFVDSLSIVYKKHGGYKLYLKVGDKEIPEKLIEVV